METTISSEDLTEYVRRQCNSFFPDRYALSYSDINKCIKNALDRTEFCFSKLDSKYYKKDNKTCFNHMNSEQYCMFLWFLSNEAYRNNNINLAEKLFYLNKALNGLDAFYSIGLPDIFILVHPVGTVLGRAEYKNYLVIYQNVTVGGDPGTKCYPKLSENTILYAGSKVIGKSFCGKNVSLSAGSIVINTDIPDDTIVFGCGKDIILKENKKKLINESFIGCV